MPKQIRAARRVMREAFEADPDFKRTYIDNIAMFLHDEFVAVDKTMLDKQKRDNTAERLLDVLFRK